MNRKSEIVKLILSADDFISVETISKSMNISDKTIRNELNDLEVYIIKNKCQLVRKPGIGVFIEGTLKHKQALVHELQVVDRSEVSSVEARQQNLLLQLLTHNKPLLIKELVLDYYVSRTTINKDIQTLNQQLEEFGLVIEYQKGEGLLVVGEEANKRQAIAKHQALEASKHIVVHKLSDHEDDFMSHFEKLLNVNFNEIEKIVKAAEGDLGFSFSSEARINLVIHIAIAINRTMQGNDIALTDALIAELKNQKEYDIAYQTAKRIEKEFKVSLSQTEIYYILLHFLGAKRIKELNVGDMKLSTEQSKLEDLILLFIKRVQLDMNIFLEADTQLFNSLMLHLKPTINRLMYGLSLDNPLYEEIRFSYPSIYEAVENNIHLFVDTFEILMPENEIAYLVLHFAAAQERNSKPINTLVMCASGLGTSQLIVAKLKRAFSNLNIVDVVASFEKDNYLDADLDLIVSTIPISSPIKTVVISPLLPETDMNVIRQIVEGDYKLEIVDYAFNQQNVFVNKHFQDKDEALAFLAKQAGALGWAKANYLEGLYYRESLGESVVQPYVAIPHADFNTINTSNLMIVFLDEPLDWLDNFKVKVIINVLAKKSDAHKFKGLFENLADLSLEDTWWDSLFDMEDETLINSLNERLLNHHRKGKR